MRRRLRFSVRTLLILLTAACLWLGHVSYTYQRQHWAVRLVQDLGGQVAWKNGGPEWLVTWLGHDPFAYVWEVSFVDAQIHDDDLSMLSDFSRLEEIFIVYSLRFLEIAM
jgi:hypothetical protein